MSDAHLPRLQLLKNLGFNPRTILDLGAYQGKWTEMAHQLWPNANIFMVEANEDQRETLTQTAGAIGFEMALLGSETGKKALYYVADYEFPTGNSIYKEQTHFFDNYEIRNLPIVTLDSLVERRKLRNIDFIKIDTQGSELDIIKGGKKQFPKRNLSFLRHKTLNTTLALQIH